MAQQDVIKVDDTVDPSGSQWIPLHNPALGVHPIHPS